MGTTQQHGRKRGGRDAFVALWRWLDRPYLPQAVGFVSVAALILLWLAVVSLSGCTFFSGQLSSSPPPGTDPGNAASPRPTLDLWALSLFHKHETPMIVGLTVGPDGMPRLHLTGPTDQPLSAAEGYVALAMSLQGWAMIFAAAGVILLFIKYGLGLKLPFIGAMPTWVATLPLGVAACLIAISMAPQWVWVVVVLAGAGVVGFSYWTNLRSGRRERAAEQKARQAEQTAATAAAEVISLKTAQVAGNGA
ncbi:MAG: hypothetical protein AAGI54_08150 [Planctomycetota bacterium]